MSVRRLAEVSIQPGDFAFTEENERWARAKLAEYPAGRQMSAVIPLLWRAQEQEGWISRAAIETVAAILDMAYIRVLEVATFYTQFLLHPVGSRAHVMICGTTPCMLRGAEELVAVCQHRIGHEPLEPNAAGTLSWEEVECLGACVNAPMVMIGNDTYEDLTVERFEAIVDAFEAGHASEIRPGPQIARQFSAAEGGATTLLEQPTAERSYKPFPPPAPPPAPAAAAPAPPAAPAAASAATAPVAAPPGSAAAPAPAAPKPAEPPAKAAAPAAAGTPPASVADEKSAQDGGSPTTPGRKRKVGEEGAPALRDPEGAPKVSEARAEAERRRGSAAANADGEPNRAMREEATGAESPAGKTDAGASPAKPANRAPRKPSEE